MASKLSPPPKRELDCITAEELPNLSEITAETAEVGGVTDRLSPETEATVVNLTIALERQRKIDEEAAAAVLKANTPELRRLTVMLEKNQHRNFKVSCLDIELDMREAVSEFVNKFLEAREKHPTRINIMDALTFSDF